MPRIGLNAKVSTKSEWMHKNQELLTLKEEQNALKIFGIITIMAKPQNDPSTKLWWPYLGRPSNSTCFNNHIFLAECMRNTV